jgi:beta-glucanase (GH16 family)
MHKIFERADFSKSLLAPFALVTLLIGCGGGGGGGADSPETAPFFQEPENEWQLVWSDEFDGSSLDASNWTAQLGDGSQFGPNLVGWGNNEEQWYAVDNLTVADGNLTITAKNESLADGYQYSSGRIRSIGKMDFKYGRVEARIKAAPGQGLWSAFWMLPTDSPYGDNWAAHGEIDIMEITNADTDDELTFQTLHYGFDFPLNQQSGTDVLSSDASSDFHTYAIEWEENEIRWFIDGEQTQVVTSDTYYSYFYDDAVPGYVEGGAAAPFDTNFHLLLNLAVGGNLPGAVEPGDIPSEMVVDYVRVYSCSYELADGSGCNVNADRTMEPAESAEIFTDSFDLYVDSLLPLSWTVAGQTVERELAVNSFWDNDGALTFAEVAAADSSRGNVIDVMTSNSGNISINAVDGEITALFGMSTAGELKFDLYIDSADTDPESSIFIKMDSGWPALGFVELKVADLPWDQWTPVSVKISDLLANPGESSLSLGAVISFMVLEPTSNAHVQLDNIQLACGHPGKNRCGILPPGGEVEGGLLEVFVDEIAVQWTKGICGWDTNTGVDYCGDGNTINLVNWSIQDTGEEGHDEVIMVDFGNNGANGVWYIGAAGGIDLSDFVSKGKFYFDLRLGSGWSSELIMKIDCFDPCSTGDIEVDTSDMSPGEWKTFEFKMSDFVAAGLDASAVNSSPVLLPTWDNQQNQSFEIDNIRWEIPADDGGSGGGDPTFAGTWQLSPEAGALAVGPEMGSSAWWSNTADDVGTRSCLFDDQFIFGTDGTFSNVQDGSTWVEAWQGVAEECGTPVAPHDGSNAATWEYDEVSSTLTLTGLGAHVGISKATNAGELASPSEAPQFVAYTATLVDATTAIINIEAGAGVHWTFKLTKTAEPAGPPPIVGTWRLASEAGALAVGPEAGSSAWWSNSIDDVGIRSCLFDDDYVFDASGSFSNVQGGSTWTEAWQGVAEECGTPVAPHDGSNSATWEYDENAGTISLTGAGAYLGLSKPTNAGELASPGDTPGFVDYNVTFVDDNTMIVAIEAGAGVHWTYKMVKVATAAPPPIVGSWSLAATAGALAVGPEMGSSAWWSNSADDVGIRSCLFDDEYVFSANGSFSNIQDGSTWTEAWQGVAEECGTPVAPHDGSNSATWEYDENAGSVTLVGTGAYLGVSKATNDGELASPGDTPAFVSYNIEFLDDTTIMVFIEAGAGVHWTYTLWKN